MKTDKEYPATHSMSTAWYCADEEGNVAIIDIEDDGPVPVGEYRQNCRFIRQMRSFYHAEIGF